jgi:hypothetical protein
MGIDLRSPLPAIPHLICLRSATELRSGVFSQKSLRRERGRVRSKEHSVAGRRLDPAHGPQYIPPCKAQASFRTCSLIFQTPTLDSQSFNRSRLFRLHRPDKSTSSMARYDTDKLRRPRRPRRPRQLHIRQKSVRNSNKYTT